MKKNFLFIILWASLNCNVISAQVGINTSAPGSTLDVNGSLAASYVTVSVPNYAMTNTDFYVAYNGTSNSTFNLPASLGGAGNFKGRMYTIKNNTNFQVTIVPAGSESINGNTSVIIDANQSLQLINTGLTGSGITWEGTLLNGTVTASNGLTASGNDIKLGGTLSQATNIATAGNNLSVTGTGKMLLGTTSVPAGAANSKIVIDNGTTNGALQIKDGTQQLGYVLTSDANGLATWSSTVTTAFADNWTAYNGTLVNPFTGSVGASGLSTGVSVAIPSKGWYFFRSGIAINSDCNDYYLYINGIGDVWRSYCGSNTAAFMFPRDQNRVLYFASPGTYTVLAGKTNGLIPSSFNAGNPSFYLDFVKFQN